MAIENAALFESEQAANQESLLLNEIARRTAASLDLEEIVEAAADELRKLIPFDTHGLLLFENGHVVKVISPDPAVAALAGAATEEFIRQFLDKLRESPVVVLPESEGFGRRDGETGWPDLRVSAAIALVAEGKIIGSFHLGSASEDAFANLDTTLLERVATQLSLAIKNARLYDEIKQMHLGNLKALSSALNAKDYYTLGHAARVAAYMVMLTRELGWPEEVLDQLEEAAYLHDIGKISISDRVLLKPGRLNPQEWEQMKQHPVFSAEIIRPLFPDELVLGVRHHHEHYDGSGYPDGLAGDAIPPLARIMAVVDAYDAMSCRRPYKTALTYPECLTELHRCRGTQFDPLMVDAFLEVLEDVARKRARAEEIATIAAAAIPGEKHARLRSRDDEDTPEYREIADTLRAVRDANPPTRFLTTHAQIDKKYVIGVDPEESDAERSHFGDEIFADDELPMVLAGERPHVNTVFADEFGVWVTGLAPVRDAKGGVVAAVAADLPALGAAESESLRSDGRQTFASMLQSAAVRLSRAEIDSITDALTGLYNHRYLHERLSEELLRARELGKPLSVLFCDLDHFKGYNDANGHSAGDVVLREVAHMIEQSVRNVDVAGRYGGEEFVVLLVETGRAQALTIAERIRERIRAADFTAHEHATHGEHRRRRLPRGFRPPRRVARPRRPRHVPGQTARPRPGGGRRRELRAVCAVAAAQCRRSRDPHRSSETLRRRGDPCRRGRLGPAPARDALVAAPQGEALPVEGFEEGLSVAPPAADPVAKAGQRHAAIGGEHAEQLRPRLVHSAGREPEFLVEPHHVPAARQRLENSRQLLWGTADLVRKARERRRRERLS